MDASGKMNPSRGGYIFTRSGEAYGNPAIGDRLRQVHFGEYEGILHVHQRPISTRDDVKGLKIRSSSSEPRNGVGSTMLLLLRLDFVAWA